MGYDGVVPIERITRYKVEVFRALVDRAATSGGGWLSAAEIHGKILDEWGKLSVSVVRSSLRELTEAGVVERLKTLPFQYRLPISPAPAYLPLLYEAADGYGAPLPDLRAPSASGGSGGDAVP